MDPSTELKCGENSATIFADFVETLKHGLDNSTEDSPPKKQKKCPESVKKQKLRKKSKLEDSLYVGGSGFENGDRSEKLVRNLFAQKTVQISPFSAVLVATNFFLTDENQNTDKYSIVSGAR